MLGGLQGRRSALLGRGTVGEPCHLGRSQANWIGLADNPAQKRVPKEMLSVVCGEVF